MADEILVTGANGFIGSALCLRLHASGFRVKATVRDRGKQPGNWSRNPLAWAILHDQSSDDDMQRVLEGVRSVVHLAARVHVMADHAPDPIAEFRKINRDWTERLARAAATQGARRFVYLSSIKVNGESNVAPFTEQDPPNPQNPYGISKWEAEQVLSSMSSAAGIETVVLRSPLVYGPGVGGNFLRLLEALYNGIPLPLASIHNLRSLIYRGNLVDALMATLQDARATGQTYIVSDGEDLSTPELLRRLAKAMGVKVRLWSLPSPVLRWTGRLAGRRAMVDRLLDSLRVDSSKIRRELAWQAPVSVDEGLRETASWFDRRSRDGSSTA